jgi:hypothetical protein
MGRRCTRQSDRKRNCRSRKIARTAELNKLAALVRGAIRGATGPTKRRRAVEAHRTAPLRRTADKLTVGDIQGEIGVSRDNNHSTVDLRWEIPEKRVRHHQKRSRVRVIESNRIQRAVIVAHSETARRQRAARSLMMRRSSQLREDSIVIIRPHHFAEPDLLVN